MNRHPCTFVTTRLIILTSLFVPSFILFAEPGSRNAVPFAFLIHTSNAVADTNVVTRLKPYLKEGDIVAAGCPRFSIDTNLVNQRLDYLRSALTDCKVNFAILCSGTQNLATIAQSIAPTKATYLFYDYEAGWEQEFTTDLGGTLANLRIVECLARKAGFKGGVAPTGRHLHAGELKTTPWDYGQLAGCVDAMIMQLQSKLKADFTARDLMLPSYRKYARLLKSQCAAAQATTLIYPQVTLLSGKNANGVPVEYCIAGIKVLKDEGFAGVSLWYALSPPSVADDLVAILKPFRMAR